MIKKIAGIVSSLCICSFSFGQTDSAKTEAPAAPPPPTFTGSVDVYYRYNFSNAKDAEGKPFTNNYTSFTNSQNSFEIGMVSLQAAHSFGKASVFADLGFGRRAQEFNYPDGDGGSGTGGNNYFSLASVKQAFVSYAVTSKFKLTMGKWSTHVGYELVDAYLNSNYSMDYMFSYGPFSHTGIKADISLGGTNTLMLGVANTTDNSTTLSSRKYAIAQFSTATKNSKLKAYINYVGSYGGSMDVTQLDVVLIGTVSDKFSIGYNGTVKMVKPDTSSNQSSWGSAVYLTASPSSNFSITLRGEYFGDEKNDLGFSAFGFGTDVFDLTLSPNFKIGNLTIIPEIRLDDVKDDGYFLDHDGNSTKSTFTGILAATYHF